MCFHIKQTKDAQSLQSRFKVKIKEGTVVTSARINGFTYPKTPIITNHLEDEIQLYNWGLIPAWAKDNSIRAYTLNAKLETLTEKPSFKDNIKNRCLIIADGFFEWKWLDPKGKTKQQYLITLPDNSAFAFAGIYSAWVDKGTGEIINTYSIVTTEANPFMAEIHNIKKRMPVILTTENELSWLKEKENKTFQSVILY